MGSCLTTGGDDGGSSHFICFLDILLIVAGLLRMMARKVATPAKELEQKVTRLEEELDSLKR